MSKEDELKKSLTWHDYGTIRRNGGSLRIILPAPFVKMNGFYDGQRVKLEMFKNTITITPVDPNNPPKNLNKRITDFAKPD